MYRARQECLTNWSCQINIYHWSTGQVMERSDLEPCEWAIILTAYVFTGNHCSYKILVGTMDSMVQCCDAGIERTKRNIQRHLYLERNNMGWGKPPCADSLIHLLPLPSWNKVSMHRDQWAKILYLLHISSLSYAQKRQEWNATLLQFGRQTIMFFCFFLI